ncbi:type I glyceraldehyde-3-phosphate dehydrogenase, partial [Escherichia coli]
TLELPDRQRLDPPTNIRLPAQRHPANHKWEEVVVHVVAEATGLYLTDETARQHITAGAQKVVLTAPSTHNTPMFVKGANSDKYA